MLEQIQQMIAARLRACVNRRWLAIVLLLCVGLVQGCGASLPPRVVPFNEGEYLPYVKPGNAALTGEVDAPRLSQGAETGTRCEEAVLVPVTRYSTEWFEREVLKGEPLSEPDARSRAYERRVPVKGASHFHFYNLAPGTYYVACRMTSSRWYMDRKRPTMFARPGWIYATVKVNPGEQLVVRLAPGNGERQTINQ